MRDTFVRTLITLAKNNPNIELFTGDLGFGVLKPFWEQLPDQFVNAGIAEQNMTAAAAGAAGEGKIVFTYSIGNFPTLRCLEQIRNDCAYHDANVKIVCVGGGFVYGSLGMSHQATEDIAVMRALPNVAVLCPGDPAEAEAATKAIAEYPGTCYLRLGRGGEKRIHKDIENFKIGQAIRIHNGERIAVFSTGAILDEVVGAADILAKKGNLSTVKPYCAVQGILKLSQSLKNTIFWADSAVRLRKFFLSCLRMQDCCVSAWMILTVRLWEVKNICGCNSDWMQTVLQSVFRRQSDEAAAVDLHGSDGDSVSRAACEISFRAWVFR